MSTVNTGYEVKFAGTAVLIDGLVVAKVTAFNNDTSISEEDVTAAENVIPGTDVLHGEFTPIAVNETAAIEGITIERTTSGRDVGQSELKDAAQKGKIVTIRRIRNTGYGDILNGFFTAFNETGDVSGVYKFKSTFRVNSVTEVVPGS
ncbi:MAG: hypothetical protein JXB50_07830 [Spirochaetes bacterium]|nr:hypothetical protein [Spirochaetota bacterium]